MRGTLYRVISSFDRSEAAIIGKQAFLEPLISISPFMILGHLIFIFYFTHPF